MPGDSEALSPDPAGMKIDSIRVPRDGECLFHAIAVLCEAEGGGRPAQAGELRALCADAAALYSEEVAQSRGLSVAEYAARIRERSQWGDVLEARMLVEQRFDRVRLTIWNLEQGFPVSVGADAAPLAGHLVHTGSHFEPLVSVAPDGAVLRRLFPGDDAQALASVQEHVARLAPAYAKCMRCDECGALLRSNAAAHQHMEETEHCFFSEVGPGGGGGG